MWLFSHRLPAKPRAAWAGPGLSAWLRLCKKSLSLEKLSRSRGFQAEPSRHITNQGPAQLGLKGLSSARPMASSWALHITSCEQLVTICDLPGITRRSLHLIRDCYNFLIFPFLFLSPPVDSPFYISLSIRTVWYTCLPSSFLHSFYLLHSLMHSSIASKLCTPLL